MRKLKPKPGSTPAAPAATPPQPKPRLDLKNLVTRVGTALVFAVFFLSLLYFGGDTPWGRWTYLALMAVSAYLGVREFCLIGRKMGFNPSMPAAGLTALLLLLHFAFDLRSVADPAIPLWLVLVVGGLVIHFGALFYDKDLDKALPSQAITWLAALYMGLGLGFQQKLFQFEGTLPKTGSRLILALYIIVWFGDTAAYFVGSTFGRHKLAPRVSPKKSWEGAGGNLAGNLLGAWLMQVTVCPEWSLLYALGMGLVLGVAGQLGDLVESTWKRSAGVKDSNVGVSIPGHGGILDRVDSLVFAAPLMYAYLVYVR
jgi:phosphatidate cytidylyltransferase